MKKPKPNVFIAPSQVVGEVGLEGVMFSATLADWISPVLGELIGISVGARVVSVWYLFQSTDFEPHLPIE